LLLASLPPGFPRNPNVLLIRTHPNPFPSVGYNWACVRPMPSLSFGPPLCYAFSSQYGIPSMSWSHLSTVYCLCPGVNPTLLYTYSLFESNFFYSLPTLELT
jgi:hypothetical protein